MRGLADGWIGVACGGSILARTRCLIKAKEETRHNEVELVKSLLFVTVSTSRTSDDLDIYDGVVVSRWHFVS